MDHGPWRDGIVSGRFWEPARSTPVLTNLVAFAAIVVAIIIIGMVFRTFKLEDAAERALAEAVATGMNLPPSLHPVIDLETCIGSAACINACPETVLGRVAGITQMVDAGNCIGHGRCHASCPVGAIALVFGTAERGVDIPLLRAGYETNVDGVLIVGELGGMGLIKNAMAQGLKGVDTIPKVLQRPGALGAAADGVDVVIVGAGPAGIAAAIGCVQKKLSFVLLEQYTLGGAITHYPRRKLVFSETIELPLVGNFGKSEMVKGELIAEFERVLGIADIEIQEHSRVTAIEGGLGNFRVKVETESGPEVHRGRTVILAIGRRGTPRKLGVPGEDLQHVVYRLIDAEQYRHRRVLCVGGGDSAVESAIALSLIAGTEVHLSYRGKSLYRVKKNNREDFNEAVAKGKLTAHFETNVREFTSEIAILTHDNGNTKTLRIDDVIVNIGGVLPTAFLESIGVAIETKFGDVAKKPKFGRNA